MDSLDLSVLEAVGKWSDLGHSFALVTVARTWGSAPRLPGAWLALRDDGLVQGSVSGGCVEDDLVERLRAGRHTGVRPFSVSYGGNKHDAERFGLPCGGILELVVESAPDRGQLRELRLRITRGEMVRRTINLENGETQLHEGARSDGLEWDGTRLTTLHGPVGLSIGSRTPPEIAVAILAEITAVIHGVRLVRVGGNSDMANVACETNCRS